MKKFAAAFFGLALFCSGNAAAQTADDIKKIENYLNGIKTMEARFVQTASNGNTAEGKFYIEKPNKIRMTYDAPTSVLIVGDGNFIVYNDTELDQVTHIDYDDIPASLIFCGLWEYPAIVDAIFAATGRMEIQPDQVRTRVII